MMKLSAFFVALALAASSTSAIELTIVNWKAETEGKTVFLKFFAPWCGHCKKMKPDWDKLMETYATTKNMLVAEVDCTDKGKQLCKKHDVKGYPAIKYGDPSELEDYVGGRDFDSLKEFADEYVVPSCSVKNIEVCSDEDKAQIKEYQESPLIDLQLESAVLEKQLNEAMEGFEKLWIIAEEKATQLEFMKEVIEMKKLEPASAPSANEEGAATDTAPTVDEELMRKVLEMTKEMVAKKMESLSDPSANEETATDTALLVNDESTMMKEVLAMLTGKDSTFMKDMFAMFMGDLATKVDPVSSPSTNEEVATDTAPVVNEESAPEEVKEETCKEETCN